MPVNNRFVAAIRATMAQVKAIEQAKYPPSLLATQRDRFRTDIIEIKRGCGSTMRYAKNRP